MSTDALFTLNTSLEHKDTSKTNANGSGVTGVCFVRDPSYHSGTQNFVEHFATQNGGVSSLGDDDGSNEDAGSSSSSSDDDSTECQPLQFRCSNLLLGSHATGKDIIMQQPSSYQQATLLSAASHNSLSGAVLASCHQDGSCKLWDLATRRCIVEDICQKNRGGGLALRRLGNDGLNDMANNQFLYQTRDPLGTVSLHDMNRPCDPIIQFHTYSSSFCAMAPCQIIGTSGGTTQGGEKNLVALPTEEHSIAIVRDLRCNPSNNPAWKVTVGDEYISSMYGSRRKYGMITSLALCLQETTQRIVMGCGMENGSGLFYDLGTSGNGRSPWVVDAGAVEVVKQSSLESDMIDSRYMCHATLGKNPVLSLDLASSSYNQTQLGGEEGNELNNTNEAKQKIKSISTSLVAVGGCAGDADEMSELPEKDQGTVSTIKVKLVDDSSAEDDTSCSFMKASIRAKTRTCSVDSGGKVGVSICRFRPDGRVFAVGGWDHRLRIFGRSSSKPLAILRGHEESVTAMDWSDNAAVSGLLATGANDGRVCIYRVLPHSSRK